MAMKRNRKDVKLSDCLKEYLRDTSPTECNVISALNIAFVKCYEHYLGEEKDEEKYVSMFSSVASKLLYVHDNNNDKDDDGSEYYFGCDKVKPLLTEVSKRYNEIVDIFKKRQQGCVYVFDVELKSRLIVGMRGSRFPMECSLAWDHVFNLPYIPSSSIKGVICHYLKNFNVEGLNFEDLCGSSSDEKGHKGSMGSLIVLDAYPISCSKTLLEPDVITPHYSEIENRIDETSSRPRPIIMLTVAPKTVFRVVIEIRGCKYEQQKIIEAVARALESGLGAKTSLGYGRVVFTSKMEEANVKK